jgi:hypothetical protein
MFRLRLSLLLVVLFHSTSFAAAVHVTRGIAGARFGHATGDAGDVNNDGRPDFIVGAPQDDTNCFDCGRAYLWLARSSGYSSLPSLTYNQATTSSSPQSGWNVAGIGDVNDDGYDDVAVGAPYADIPGADAGAVFVYFGGATPNNVVDLTLRGETGDDRFGYWISRGGDLNGDGIDDFLVGAPYADATGQDAGAVYLFVGSSGAVSTLFARRFDGEIAGDHFGWSVAEVSDFRGNGVASFVVGAPGWGADAGRAYLFYGGTGNTLPNTGIDVTFDGAIGGDEMGYAVSSIGRFNNDARTDVAVGTPGHQGDTGAVRVWLGQVNPAASPTRDMQIVGGTGGDRFGEAVSGVGDHVGSTLDDLLAGAPLRDVPAANSGHAYVFAGGTTYTSVSQGSAITPTNPSAGAFSNDNFGFAVSGLGGDMDGDLKADLLVGSPVANNASNVTSGAVALIGSSTGIVPVGEIPFATLPQGDWLELRFGGLAVSANRAELWGLAVAPRLLVASGGPRDFRLDGDALSASIPWSELTGLSQVELRLWHDGTETSRRFELPAVPGIALRLFEPAPNPFNPQTRLRFALAARAPYELTILDSRGRLVRHLASGVGGPGELEFEFDGRDDRGARLSSGSYRALLRSGDEVRSKGLTLIE